MDCVFEMPIPPSLNNIYLNAAKRRIKTPEYIEWKSEAMAFVGKQGVPRFSTPVIVDISVPERRGDIDNRAKPVLDVLVGAGVLKNDNGRYVREVRIRWGDKARQTARISLKEAVE